MSDAVALAAIIALATCLVAAVGSIVYFGKTAIDSRTASGVDRATAAVAAVKVEQANASSLQLAEALKASQARVVELEKEASDDEAAVPAGHGVDSLRGLATAAGGATVPGPSSGAGQGGGDPGKSAVSP